MGSFNTACFASRQVITPGDQVILIPIMQHVGTPAEIVDRFKTGESLFPITPFSTTCYSTCFWRYFSQFIEAEYDDYGKFTFSESPENVNRVRHMLNKLGNEMFETKLGENRYHDVAGSIPKIDDNSDLEAIKTAWDEISDGVFESRVFVKDFHGRPVAFSFASLLKSAFDELLSIASKQKLYDGTKLDIESMCIYGFKSGFDLFSEIDEDTEQYLVSSLVSFAFNNVRYLGGYSGISVDYPIKSSTIDIDRDAAILAFRQYIASEKKDFSALVELVKPIVEWPMKNLLVNAALGLMEIRIEPTYYVGQDYSNDIGMMFKKFVTNVSKTHTKFLKEKHNDN